MAGRALIEHNGCNVPIKSDLGSCSRIVFARRLSSLNRTMEVPNEEGPCQQEGMWGWPVGQETSDDSEAVVQREMFPLFLACRAGRSRFAFEMKGQRLEYNLARSRGTWLVRRKIASRPDRQPNKVLAAEGLKIPRWRGLCRGGERICLRAVRQTVSSWPRSVHNFYQTSPTGFEILPAAI